MKIKFEKTEYYRSYYGYCSHKFYMLCFQDMMSIIEERFYLELYILNNLYTNIFANVKNIIHEHLKDKLRR